MAKQKIQLLKDDIEKIRAAQDRGFEMVKAHLAKQLEELEHLGYSRIELACAYLGLAYHILRYGRPREKADREFELLSQLTKARMIEKFAQRRVSKKLH